MSSVICFENHNNIIATLSRDCVKNYFVKDLGMLQYSTWIEHWLMQWNVYQNRQEVLDQKFIVTKIMEIQTSIIIIGKTYLFTTLSVLIIFVNLNEVCTVKVFKKSVKDDSGGK